MEFNPIVSILIPTKDRYEYLTYLVDYFITLESRDIELVIQDNSADNSTFIAYLSTIKDERIVYNYVAEWLCVSDNCDCGVSLCAGEYVTMIGDDDGFLPYIDKVCQLLKNAKIDALITKNPSYLWPDMVSKQWGSKYSGTVDYSTFTNEVKIIDAKKLLQEALKEAGTEIMMLPRIYHGIISRRCLIKLKEEAGSFFPGASPDMANAIGILKYLDKLVSWDFPVIISGQAARSVGGMGQRKEHKGKLSSVSFLPKSTEEDWEHEVPKFWSGATIYADSMIKALKATGRTKDSENYNYQFLYAYLTIYEFSFRETIFSYELNYIKKYPLTIVKYIYYVAILFVTRLINYIKNNIRMVFNITTYKHTNIHSITEAIEVLNTQYNDDRINVLSDC